MKDVSRYERSHSIIWAVTPRGIHAFTGFVWSDIRGRNLNAHHCPDFYFQHQMRSRLTRKRQETYTDPTVFINLVVRFGSDALNVDLASTGLPELSWSLRSTRAQLFQGWMPIIPGPFIRHFSLITCSDLSSAQVCCEYGLLRSNINSVINICIYYARIDGRH